MKLSSTKIFIIIISILVVALLFAFIYKANVLNEYSKNINFNGKYVNIKLYMKNEIEANNIFDEVENIYNSILYPINEDNNINIPSNIYLDKTKLTSSYNNEVIKYLKSKNINKYMINEGGNIYLGDTYKNKLYNVGIVNPIENKIYKIIKGKNINISSITGSDKILGVTVISKLDSSILANILILMDLDSGINYIKDYDADVIWFLSDGTIKTTKGITNYE